MTPEFDFEEDIFFEDDEIDPLDVLDLQMSGHADAAGCTCGGPYCACCGCCACLACPGGCIWATPTICSACVRTAAAS